MIYGISPESGQSHVIILLYQSDATIIFRHGRKHRDFPVQPQPFRHDGCPVPERPIIWLWHIM